MVIYKRPGRGALASCDIGMVMTCWKGVRKPKPSSSPVPINACTAFRVVSLDLADAEQDWFVGSGFC